MRTTGERATDPEGPGLSPQFPYGCRVGYYFPIAYREPLVGVLCEQLLEVLHEPIQIGGAGLERGSGPS